MKENPLNSMTLARLFLLVAVLTLSAMGCGPKTGVAAPDVNGYICNACKTQFFTTKAVEAQHCPQCKSFDMAEVRTYVCSADQQRTIAPKSREGAACKQCKAMVEATEQPTVEELKAWGAIEKSAAEVGVN